MHGSEDGETGIDDNVAAKGFEGIGAYILGRNYVWSRAWAMVRGAG
jgi:hypothetical protein